MKELVLIDMLMSHTSRLMRMMTDGIFDGEDFTQCRNTILAIQTEIKKQQLNFSAEDDPSLVKLVGNKNFKETGIIH
ncbi:MAG: hypothetical protein ABIT05_13920 [Chitinophagaceae bacterium]